MSIYSLTTSTESRLSELKRNRGYPKNVCHDIIPIVTTNKNAYWRLLGYPRKACGKVMLYPDHTKGCFPTVGDLSTRWVDWLDHALFFARGIEGEIWVF